MELMDLIGEYEPTPLAKVVYGRGSIQRLPELLESLKATKAFIVTGSSLQNKTPVIEEIESILGDKHVKTFSKIAQHAPIRAIREAAEEAKIADVDVFISVGGGSPIDSTKGVSYSDYFINCSNYTFLAERFRSIPSSYCCSYHSFRCRYVSWYYN
jgi:alcohol dehydrogenase YqhD (iron-dependent ADH family)